jgi:hypothetical protein
LLEETDETRIEQVVELAESSLPLSQIASGPAGELGVGKPFAPHRALDSILFGLERFPGRGYRLVCAGLQSPVIRARHMAVQVLQSWGREKWPDGTEALLTAARAIEVDEGVRYIIDETLAPPPVDPQPGSA